MVNSQEIIERSIYKALLDMAIRLEYTVDPEKYLPISDSNKNKFKHDREDITRKKGFFIDIFGVGNNQSRGIKYTPRITVESEGFYPGDIGLPKEILEREGIGYNAYEMPSETMTQYINIRLCATNVDLMRKLHQIMFWSIPQRGYIKPYNEARPLFTGNIFIRQVNFYNMPDLENGLMEKVYQFEIQDCLLENSNAGVAVNPIRDISVLLENDETLLRIKK